MNVAHDWRSLTVHQPWAWAISEGIKPIENRGAPPPAALVGEWIAIHAGRAFDKAAPAAIKRIGIKVPPREDLAFGAILSVACIAGWVDVRRGLRFGGVTQAEAWAATRSPWFCGPVGIILAPPVKLDTPIPLRGFQGWPRVPAEIADRLEGLIS